jgi:four helix bundle protein
MENDRAKWKNDFKIRLYAWALRLLKHIDRAPKSTVSDVMGRQLVRSGTSVLANYIEANSASSKKDFTNFFTHALKSANESKVWLTLMRDMDVGNKEELSWLSQELIEIANILASSILRLKGKK